MRRAWWSHSADQLFKLPSYRRQLLSLQMRPQGQGEIGRPLAQPDREHRHDGIYMLTQVKASKVKQRRRETEAAE
jgi:hypothetical protein